MVALKSLVIGLGVLIVGGMTLLAWGVYQQAADTDFRLLAESPADERATPARTPPAPFGDVALRLPEGCSIATMRPQGDRLFLRIGPPGPCARVIVVDVARGRVLGTIGATP